MAKKYKKKEFDFSEIVGTKERKEIVAHNWKGKPVKVFVSGGGYYFATKTSSEPHSFVDDAIREKEGK